MKYRFGFGKQTMEFELREENVLAEIRQNDVKGGPTGREEVVRSLAEPYGSERLRDIVRPGEKIVIVTSDITRPMPSKVVLPPVLNELYEAGVSPGDVTVVFALGSHRRHTEAEMKQLVGEDVYADIRCVDSDPSDCVRMGSTRMGTPVDIFRTVAEADRRICLGNIEYHYFAGYSGGAKAILPGVSTRDTIQKNHSAMVRQEARAGAIDDNPVRLDMDEVLEFVPIDFIVNVVLDEHKSIVRSFSGHPIRAHREGCRFLDSLYKVEIPRKADVVITTPGGYPKDINLYQAQKALDNAKHAVRDGGIVILAAACSEGLGEKVFERWMLGAESPDRLISDIGAHFELGGHKAAAIALVLKKARIFLVSEMEDALVRKLFLEPFKSVDGALEEAFRSLGRDARVILMPFGGSTLPVVKNQPDGGKA